MLKGVGRVRAQALKQAGITRVADLLCVLPNEYRDTRTPCAIQNLLPGTRACVAGRISAAPSGKPGGQVLRASLRDDSGVLPLVFFNQPWIKNTLHKGDDVTLYGTVSVYQEKLQLTTPVLVQSRGMEPVYPAIGAIPGSTVSRLVREALALIPDLMPETLPESLRLRWHLCAKDYALRQAHTPENDEALRIAQRRLAFEDLLLYQVALRGLRGARGTGARVAACEADADAFWTSLPFPPTGAQVRVLREIVRDMAAEAPMSRLVQGDVGSGKTALALGAMALAARSGFQCAIMAPTEILARQHYDSLMRTLAPLGIACDLLTGSTHGAARKRVLDALETGACQCIAGTHALISENVRYHNLGLVITDEQHRFGVSQRRSLSLKGNSPNVLVMSATPIPRTLAMVLYGDLDISVLDEMPPGRKPVQTRVVPPEKRDALYAFVRAQASRGAQAYVVCPLVTESDALEGVQSAQGLYEALCSGPLRGISVALMHGQLPDAQKNAVMEAFARGDTRVLVSTTVIEVGVNVPAATLMIIENAERFGLSQLHQLRGRVGRGRDESWCFLLGEPCERLSALTATHDGFRIAEEDLRARGPGAMLGTRQSGLSDMMRMALSADMSVLTETQTCVRELYQQPACAPERKALEKAARKRYEAALTHID